MNPKEYVKNVLVTESNNFEAISSRFKVEALNSGASNAQIGKRNIRLLHAAIGISTEVGELFEFLDKPEFDFTNLREEVGDAFWYCGIAIDELGLDFEKMIKFCQEQHSTFKIHGSTEVKEHFLNQLILAVKESSILLDLLKKSAFYGKPLDVQQFESKLISFTGLMISILTLANFTLEDTLAINIAKLRKRYGEKFTEQAAITRNLDAERKILEGSI